MKAYRAPWKIALLVALATLLSACQVDWGTWGNGPERHGENLFEGHIRRDTVSGLHRAWTVNLGATINAQPIVATGINVHGTPTDLVFVGTEHGALFAISTTGRVVWLRGLGTSTQPACAYTPDGVYGVSGSVVFDRRNNRLYVADGNGYVFALDPATGATIPGWPVQLTTDGLREVVTSSPTLHGNHLYFEIASHCDLRPYHGRVVDIDPSTHSIAHTWYVTGGPTGPDGGGIWGWGGASVDSANGDVYVATGNSFASPENLPYADAVVRLSSSLSVKAFHSPTVMMGDDDFGSTPTLFQKSGCPPQLVVVQKNGSLYLYDRDTIASGYRQRVAVGRPSLIGVAGYSEATKLLYVVNPKGSTDGVYKPGLVAFRLTSACNLAPAWQTPAAIGIGSTPTIAGGVVYFAGGFSGKVHALDAVTGAELWNTGTTVTGPILAAPTVFNGRLYVAGYDGQLHVYRL